MKILLTGGAGYIGTHTAVELLKAGHDITVVDNLSNSSIKAIGRVEGLTNKSVAFYQEDLLHTTRMQSILADGAIEAVIHFAGLKAVKESVSEPLAYYKTNILATINLCESMLAEGVTRLVFSSSATVYGEPNEVPISEGSQVVDAANPYGRTKIMIEKILQDLVQARPEFNVVILRYFNPGGAHESGEIGEDPSDTPNNLLPFISQVAVGKRDELVVFGDDYATPDGTCIRDYIHVVDLAKGHLAAIEKLKENPGLVTYNVGTGIGYSVLDVIKAFETANNLTLPHVMGPRRPGDIPVSYTDPALARAEMNWQAEKSIEDICRDAWNWQKRNPEGYT
ncbi:MAG: UDP-glucose 4-epimerase GalE [Proteobacteria bacterium]|nr:UDP-glucose 4-epimerase GalE [Pseudomonadota bacterium]